MLKICHSAPPVKVEKRGFLYRFQFKPTLHRLFLCREDLPAALQSERITSPTLDLPLVLDGRLDEAAWAAADSIGPLTQVTPVQGAAPASRTVVKVLVGPGEIDPRKGKISIQSPVGRALSGKIIGDEVDVEVPAGTLRLRVTKVERR